MNVSAQDGDKAAVVEARRDSDQTAALSEPAPWLRLQLDSAGLLVIPTLPTPAAGHEVKSEFEIDYRTTVPRTPEGGTPGLSKGGAIAIGVIVPLVLVTAIGVGVTASAFNNWEIF